MECGYWWSLGEFTLRQIRAVRMGEKKAFYFVFLCVCVCVVGVFVAGCIAQLLEGFRFVKLG